VKTIFAAAALGLAIALAAGTHAQSFGTTTILDLPPSHGPSGCVSVDMNADGRTDLVIAVYDSTKKFARTLRIHHRKEGAAPFSAEPDLVVGLTPDVCAFAAGDVHADPGCELVLFTGAAAFVWRPRAGEKERVERLLACDFLWQFPGPDHALPWMSACKDLDGDGLDDLLIPEPGGYRVTYQRRAESDNGAASFGAPQVLRLPVEDGQVGDLEPLKLRRPRSERESRSLRIRLGEGEDKDAGPLLAIDESVAAPRVLDVNGDGVLDLAAQGIERLFVWTQTKGQGFDPAPAFAWALPVLADAQRRLDVSYRALAADLDGDKKTDSVIIAGDQRSEDVRTQVLVFLQGKAGSGAALDPSSPLYGAGVPRQLLVVAGFAGNPDLRDVDGDGRLDFVVGSLRVDTLDALRAASMDSIDAEVYVYRNDGEGKLSSKPDLAHRVRLKVEGLRKARRELTAAFVGDLTGDGVQELLIRDEPDHAALYMVKKQRDVLAVIERPLWEATISSEARILPETSGPGRTPELVLLEPGRVLHVRFR
jgi:hypothetical protein